MGRMNSKSQLERQRVILVVEDEDAVLRFMRQVLEIEGYRVLTARNSVEALHIGAAFNGIIDVLITDVRMRVFQNGLVLARCFNVLRPETAVFLTSGSCLPQASGNVNDDWVFLPKPFSANQLLGVIGKVTPEKQDSKDWSPVTSLAMHLA